MAKQIVDPAVIATMIHKGEENAVHLREIVKRTGLSGREVRNIIEDLRCDGDVIVGDRRGYYHPCNVVQLRRWLQQEKARLRSIEARTLSAAKMLSYWENGGTEDGGNG